MARPVRVQSLRTVPAARLRPADAAPLRAGLVAYLQQLSELVAGACSAEELATRAAACTASLGRAAAVGVLDDDGDALEVLGSAGYGCDAMEPGTRIPVATGLPLVTAAAQGEVVVRGDRPGRDRWVAVPLPGLRGALLLSDPDPGWLPGDVRGLEIGARLVAAALPRARSSDRARRSLAAVGEPLRAPATPPQAVPGLNVATRALPLDGELGLGGDVLACLPDERGGGWLVVADVRGHGAGAAVLAAQLRAALGALAPLADGPGSLLAGLGRAVAAAVPDADDPDARSATAVAVHVRRSGGATVLRVASAGHPLPLLRSGDGVRSLGEPGVLLDAGLTPGHVERREHEVRLPEQWLLVLHSDGLVDAPVPGAGEPRVQAALRGVAPSADPEVAAEVLLAAGLPGTLTAPDDVAVLVAAPAPA